MSACIKAKLCVSVFKSFKNFAHHIFINPVLLALVVIFGKCKIENLISVIEEKSILTSFMEQPEFFKNTTIF